MASEHTFKVAVLDDDSAWLFAIRSLYFHYDVAVDTYLFQDEYEEFVKDAHTFDLLIIPHLFRTAESNLNGDDILCDAKNHGFKGKVYFIIPDVGNHARLSCCHSCVSKESLKNNPLQIFPPINTLDNLRKITNELPSLMDAITVSDDGTEMLIDGWSIPYRGLLNQPTCGVCHAKALKGDTQPGFHVKQRAIIVVIEGLMEFDTISDGECTHHSVGVGDVAEMLPNSNYEPISYSTDVEFLFITIPRWEGTPEVT